MEFRDGDRDLPVHLERLLRGLDTYKMTYKEALAAANRRAENDFVRKAMNKSLSDHFRQR